LVTFSRSPPSSIAPNPNPVKTTWALSVELNVL